MSSRNGQPNTTTATSTTSTTSTSATDPKSEVEIKLDHISDLWKKLEKKLLTDEPPRRIACCYWTEHFEDEHNDFDVRYFLGIQRHAGRWRVCYAETDKSTDNDLPWKPILECDADTRKAATKGIDRLKWEVKQTRESYIPECDAAINRLEEALQDDED